MTKWAVGCCLMVAAAAVAAPMADEIARENAHTQGMTVIAGKGDVQIALDRSDAQYRCGEEAVFAITIGEATSGKVSWTLDNYGAHVFAKGTVDLAKENSFVVKGTLPYPGFLRVTVRDDRGKLLRAYSAAYEPEKIRTAVPRPDDFDAFWENAIAKLEKEVPLDPQVEQVPGWPKRGVNLQRVSFATVGGKRVYGVLATPTDAKKGPYPVRIHFPGAGAGLVMKRCHGDPDHVTLYMNSHYFPVPETDEDAKAPYAAQEAAWRKVHGPNRARAYPVGGLTLSREAAHYYGIILGVNRAIDWVAQRADIDPKRFFYTGASQGGGFGLILTALNRHITRAYAGVPAMADMLGCKADGRQSGWPRILEYETQTDPARLAKIAANVRYFDAAFFAARIRVPIRLSVGYADESCAPHAVLAAYNAIPSKDKKLYHGIGGLHGSRNAPREEVDAWLEGKVERPWFVVNEDNDHFFKCDASLMTEKGLADYVDYICRGKVSHVFFCVNGQRTSYDSKTWEPIWAGLAEKARSDTATKPDGTHDRWAVNCKKLFDAGIDPYAVWIRRCREKGVSPWVSMRMNDVHFGKDPRYFRNTSWYKAHPEYRLDPSGMSDNWFMQQLDFAHKEVQDYTMAQVKEVAARWPADGMELDWMRFGHVFKPDEELKNAPLLDAFMREASAAIRASGKQVAVRVPYDHEVCEEFGFNVVRWAKEGWVDVVIPAPFIRSASNLPVGKWQEALAGTKVRLVPDLGCEVGCSDRVRTPAVYRGVAESFFAQGASGVYLYNLPYKSNALYSSDSRGKAWCEALDVAAELYVNGIVPDDLRDLDIDCPPMVHDWPDRSMRNEAKWDAFFAREAPRYKALQAAIDTKSAAGGGRVTVVGTVWCDGPLRLKSGVELHFADGARLVFTDNPARYLPVVPTSFEGVECLNYSPLVYTYGQTNVAITGRGTIEPRIDRWIDWYNRTPDYKASLRKVYDWCCDGEPVANRDLTKLVGMDVRPQLVQFNRCGNVRLEGFRVRKSPFWVLHFLLCDGVVVKDVDVIGIGRNNDGLDLEMTKNVLVDGCSFREGDDAIVVKAGRNHDGWRLATPSENIEIRNCRVSRANAILGVGSEMSGGVRNVWMHDCVFDGFGGSLLELKTNERRGGFIRDIRVENVSAPGVLIGSVLTIATDCHYQWRDFPTREVRVTEISDITMRNVRAFKASRVLDIRGDARNPIRNLTVENVTAERVKEEDRIENARGFKGR